MTIRNNGRGAAARIVLAPDYLDPESGAKMSSAERKFYLFWRQHYPVLPRPYWNEHTVGEWKGKWDFSWPELKVVLDVHGGEFVRGHHTRGKNILDDYEKILRAHKEGWYAVAIGGTQADDPKIVGMFAEIVSRRLMSYLSADTIDCWA